MAIETVTTVEHSLIDTTASLRADLTQAAAVVTVAGSRFKMGYSALRPLIRLLKAVEAKAVELGYLQT